MKNMILNELDEDVLDNVTGGYTEDESTLWITCGYCAGRIYGRINNVDVPVEERKCSLV